MRRIVPGVLLLLCLCGKGSIAAPGVEPAPQWPSVLARLRGVKDVALLLTVIPIGSPAETSSLATYEMQRDIELKLRLAGLRVVPTSERKNEYEAELAKGKALFHVTVVDTLVGKSPRNIKVSARLSEVVRPVRDPKLWFDIATWESREVHIERVLSFPDWPGELRKMLATVTDEFVNDYLTVNPK